MTQVDKAVRAIRDIETIDCDSLRDLFNVIAAKMTEAKFSSTDMDVIDELSGFICGEEEVTQVYRQCAEEGATQRFAARGEMA